MAEGRLGRASVRLRTTVAAVVVVAIALMLGAFVLVTLVRDSLRDGVETSAEQQASSLADQIESSGLPEQPRGDDDPGEDDDEPEDEVWQVADSSGTAVRSSQPLSRQLPTEDTDEATLPGSDHRLHRRDRGRLGWFAGVRRQRGRLARRGRRLDARR